MHPFNFFMLTTVRSERVKRENMALTDKNKVSMFSRLFSCCLDDTLIITELTGFKRSCLSDVIGRFSSISSFCFVAILIDGSEKCILWLNFLLLSLHVFEKHSKERVDTSYCLLAL